jgi:hypothetical protein
LVQPNPTITIQEEKSIITNVMISQQTNHQFLHTLGNDIFIYVFGDRMGQLQIQGLSFAERCEQIGPGGLVSAANPSAVRQHGVESILSWYKSNKLSERPEPIKISIGNTVFTGFLQGMTTRVQDPRNWVVEYIMSIAIVPEKDDKDLGGDERLGDAVSDEGSASDTPADPIPGSTAAELAAARQGANVTGLAPDAGRTKLGQPQVGTPGSSIVNNAPIKLGPKRTASDVVQSAAGTEADLAAFDAAQAAAAAFATLRNAE